MQNNVLLEFLTSFFGIFNASINEYKIDGKKVYGNIRWKDENETQNFSWVIELDETVLEKQVTLVEFLKINNMINGDHIIITEFELQIRLDELGWDIIEAKKNIDFLLTVEIKMVDDGEETDSFFIHF